MKDDSIIVLERVVRHLKGILNALDDYLKQLREKEKEKTKRNNP